MSRWASGCAGPIALALGLVTLASAALAQEHGRQTATPPPSGPALERITVNADYFRMAAATGGDFYFWAPGEFARAQLEIPLEDEEVALSYGTLDREARELGVPLEPGLASVTFFLGAASVRELTILDPNGERLGPTDPRVRFQDFRFMLIATVERPAAGRWTLRVDGDGAYESAVRVRSGPDGMGLLDAEFVERGGRPGHEGWFPIRNDPNPGEALHCSVSLTQAASVLSIEWHDAEGRSTGQVALTAVEGNRTEWLAPCRVPESPFRVAVVGRNAEERPFQRVLGAWSEP